VVTVGGSGRHSDLCAIVAVMVAAEIGWWTDEI
jgi:hypothetical protein